MSDEDGAHYSIRAELGNLDLEVAGDDADWVDETFNEKLQDMLDEAEDMSTALRDGTRSHV